MSRYRERTMFYAPSGRYATVSRGKIISAWTADSSTPLHTHETCTDEVHLGPPYVAHGPLDLEEQRQYVARVTRTPYFGQAWRGMPFLTAPPWGPTVAGIPHPNWTSLFTKAIANLNPNNPEIDVPLFLFEFKDFPKMLKSAGEFLSSNGSLTSTGYADLFLSYKFGWEPLLSDLTDLAFIGESIDQRTRHLEKLAQEGGSRFRRTLKRDTTVTTGVDWIGGYPVSNGNYAWSKKSEEEIWFVAHAELDSPLPPSNPDGWSEVKAVLGLDSVSPSTIWNALPWSFVIDYFTNVGDFIATYQGNLRWSLGWVDVCQKGRVEKRLDLDDIRSRNPGASYHGGRWVTTTKRRQSQYKPVPRLAFEPFLTKGQIANLAALTMTQKWKS